MMRDDELEELLSLAEDARVPAATFETALLDELREAIAERADSSADAIADGADLRGGEPGDIVVVVPDIVARRPSPWWPRLAAVAGAAAAAVALIVVLTGPDDVTQVSTGSPPTAATSVAPIPTPDTGGSEAGDLDDEALCIELDELLTASGFLGAERSVLDDESLDRVADLLEMVTERTDPPLATAEAVIALRYAALTSSTAAADAERAHDQARSAVTALRVLDVACPA